MKLRVGVLLDSKELYAWERAMLDRLLAAEYLDVSVLAPSVTRDKRAAAAIDASIGSAGSIAAGLAAVYRSLEDRTVSVRDAFEICGAGGAITGTDVTESAQLDVVIDLTNEPSDRRFMPAARFGTWALRHGARAPGDATTAAFWSVGAGEATIVTDLEVLLPSADRPVVVERTITGRNPCSVKLTRNELCWKTLSLVPRALERLARDGGSAFLARAAKPAFERTAFTRPRSADLARHVMNTTRHRARDAASRRLDLDQWILLVHAGDKPCMEMDRFRAIVPPRDRYWADPHVVRKDDRYYVFIEELPFSTGKGHIAVLELSLAGELVGRQNVLEKEYHLSYPCIVEHGGEYFMVPESSANGTIDLYRCTGFPDRWIHEKTLMSQVSAVDPTLVYYQDRWWLFTNIAENHGASFSDELFLFQSDSLTGDWIPHAANPIVSDVRSARPAGAIFCRDGVLYRPSQDCSVRYGYAMKINRIDTLTPEKYEETPLNTILPNWNRRVIGTHTYAYTPGLTVTDALRMRFPLSL